mgnify:CR=1 FL=1|tara:strand:- start:812 stop:964 length:153 start_codon:yes stop_codon:yes gene_type:complete
MKMPSMSLVRGHSMNLTNNAIIIQNIIKEKEREKAKEKAKVKAKKKRKQK